MDLITKLTDAVNRLSPSSSALVALALIFGILAIVKLA